MITNFGIQNFFSIREGINFSCETKDTSDKYNKVLAITGANASGKTNLLKGLGFIRHFVCNSFDFKPEDDIPFLTYAGNSEATNFYITVIAEDGIKYEYELSIKNDSVVSEKIYKTKSRKVLVVERKANSLVTLASKFKELKNIKKIRSNTSIVSLGYQYEMSSITPFYKEINRICCNVGVFGRNNNWHELSEFSEYCELLKNNKDIFDYVKQTLIKCDTGITDIEIRKFETPEGIKYTPFYEHENQGNKFFIHHEFESEGTKKLFRELAIYKHFLNMGGVVVLDEFDIHLHPDLVPMIINFFKDPKLNKKGAQLIFSFHNAAIIDHLNKNQIMIVMKDDNESFAYRLDEIEGGILRNDRSIRSVYESNKIGGRPRL